MKQFETDYLVIGSGAVSMAFVDTMLDQSEATFLMIDRHHMPGGHWNDAYPFVRLHQPSALYGVGSTDLGSDTIDQTGPNKGYYELASGPEISAYFERVMRERFIASGRVQYFPMHDYLGDGKFVSLLSDDAYEVKINKRTVDGTFFNTSVPSTHTRKYGVDDGVTCVAPNELPKLASQYKHYAILGGGKTAMDAGVWLLSQGAKPDALSWVCPRESWLVNRATTQPGKAFFGNTVGAVANQLEAMIEASSVDDLFLRLEKAGSMTRINRDIMPTMFHYATISQGEIAHLARIEHVIREDRVSQITTAGMQMESGATVNMTVDTLYIDCTATAAVFTAERTYPVFEDDRISLQAVFAPLVTYSAAIIAYVEANFSDDLQKKNMLCAPVVLADTPQEWIGSTSQNMINQNNWNQIPQMRAWLNACRLNPAYAAIREKALEDPANTEIMKRIGKAAIPAVMNVQKLLAK